MQHEERRAGSGRWLQRRGWRKFTGGISRREPASSATFADPPPPHGLAVVEAEEAPAATLGTSMKAIAQLTFMLRYLATAGMSRRRKMSDWWSVKPSSHGHEVSESSSAPRRTVQPPSRPIRIMVNSVPRGSTSDVSPYSTPRSSGAAPRSTTRTSRMRVMTSDVDVPTGSRTDSTSPSRDDFALVSEPRQPKQSSATIRHLAGNGRPRKTTVTADRLWEEPLVVGWDAGCPLVLGHPTPSRQTRATTARCTCACRQCGYARRHRPPPDRIRSSFALRIMVNVL